jgi:hypothetical protein
MGWVDDPLTPAVLGVLLVLVALLAGYLAWATARLDRLYARVAAAGAVLDAELLGRAAAAQALGGPGSPLATAAAAAVRAAGSSPFDWEARAAVENELSTALRAAPVDSARRAATADAARRVAVARQVYNDSVRDTRALRGRRLVRLLRLAAGRPAPSYFDMDEAVPATLGASASPGAARELLS